MGDQKTQQEPGHATKMHEKDTVKLTQTIEATALSADPHILSRLNRAGSFPSVPNKGLSHPTFATHQATMLRTLQRRQGNAFVQRAIVQEGTAMEMPASPRGMQRTPSPTNPSSDNFQHTADQVRRRAERVTNFDLSDVQVQPNSSLATMQGVEALTMGREIHLAAGNSRLDTPHSNHVLAHEFAHIVQQGTAQTTDMERIGRREQLETHAESTAHSIDTATPAFTGRGMRTLSSPARSVAQAFDPRWHRLSLVQGLVGTGFSPEEIGQIYAANWERDFSQAHPALAAIVLTWKRVKLSASEGTLSDSEIKNFDNAVDNLVGMIPFRVKELTADKTYTYEGYQYFEHMDNPAEPSLSVSVPTGTGASIPQYMIDSREYIKAQLFYAVKAYRSNASPMSAESESGKVAAEFEEVKKQREQLIGPATILSPIEHATGKDVAGETAKEAQKAQPTEINFEEEEPIIGQRPRRPRTTRPQGGSTMITMPPEVVEGHVGPPGHWNAEVADRLGRASHALEDFFAHSNFVELAIGEIDPKQGFTKELTTGTFGDVDKKHALSHKIRALSDEIAAEMPLVNRVAGRTSQNPSPEEIHTGEEAPPTETPEEHHSWWQILKTGTALKTIATIGGHALAGATAGGLLGSFLGPIGTVAGGLIGGIMGLRSGIKSAARNVIATDNGVQLLRMVAEKLEEDTREKASPGSHTLLAKDQPGHEDTPFGRFKTIKFQLAQELAAAADRQVLGAMRQVLDAPSPESADVLLQDVYKTLNEMIAPPGPDHPLYPIIQNSLEKATQARKEYKRSSK